MVLVWLNFIKVELYLVFCFKELSNVGFNTVICNFIVLTNSVDMTVIDSKASELKLKALLGRKTGLFKVDHISHSLNFGPILHKYYKVSKSCALKNLVLPMEFLIV